MRGQDPGGALWGEGSPGPSGAQRQLFSAPAPAPVGPGGAAMPSRPGWAWLGRTSCLLLPRLALLSFL